MNETNSVLTGTNWKLLRNQKATLLKVIQELASTNRVKEADHLRGILHLLDAVQDEAARTLGETAVFGKG